MITQAAQDVPRHGRSAGLWFGVLGAPAVWALQLQSAYTLVPWACKHRTIWPLHVCTAIFVVLALVCLLVSWRDWRLGRQTSEDVSEGTPAGRTRFLGALGILVSALFSLLILAQGVASFFIDPCIQ